MSLSYKTKTLMSSDQNDVSKNNNNLPNRNQYQDFQWLASTGLWSWRSKVNRTQQLPFHWHLNMHDTDSIPIPVSYKQNAYKTWSVPAEFKVYLPDYKSCTIFANYKQGSSTASKTHGWHLYNLTQMHKLSKPLDYSVLICVGVGIP